MFAILRAGDWGFVQPKPGAPQWIGLSPAIWLLLGGGVVLWLFMEGIAFLAIITPAITSSFVARAQAQRDSEEEAADDLAEHQLDSQLQDLTGRLDRVEKLLVKLTEK